MEVLECDTSDLESVRKMADYVTGAGKPRVDVMVANAGCLMDNYTTNEQVRPYVFLSVTW